MTKSQLIPDRGLYIPENKNQFLISTPYGQGIVLRSRKDDGMHEIELSSEAHVKESSLKRMRTTTLYSVVDYPSIEPTVGSDVVCLYGRGKVVECRPHQVVVRLSSWRLANRSTIKCYLAKESVRVVRPKEVYEMSVVEKIEKAMELKKEAAVAFGQRQYSEALKIYARAVDTVKYVQHKPDSTNAIRADLLVVMITCSNNAATCCWKQEFWNDAIKHVQHASALLDALELKKGGKIHQQLQSIGHDDPKVFGVWQVKSLLILARALAAKDEIDAAVTVARKARVTVATYTTPAFQSFAQSYKILHSNDKELLKLLATLKEMRKVQLEKEKQRAQAMFVSPNGKASTQQKPKNTSAPNASKVPSPNLQTENSLSSPKDPQPRQEKSAMDGRPDKKATITKEELAWRDDPAFLGGLGFLVGVTGAMLLLTQIVSRRK